MAEKKGTQEARQQQNKPQQKTEGEQQSQSIQTSGREGTAQRGLAPRRAFEPSPWGSSPFGMMNRFADEMDRMFEDFGFGRGRLAPFGRRGLWPRGFGEMGKGAWSPEIEVFEREGQLIVRADLPGLNKDDIKVDITDDALTIQGERKHEHEQCDESFCHTERSFGSFYRSIPLPESANANEAEANFRDGVLEIVMPVPQREQRRRRIDIGEGARREDKPRARAQTTSKS